ncbi:hypothetical protein GCM10009125_28830 [Castellaniella daejeonensis]|uniref:Uncharacterized protein n=1 Tax=Castellaniella daejeonensis TaxID=659013 RepID=A0ABN0U4G0_9BURK
MIKQELSDVFRLLENCGVLMDDPCVAADRINYIVENGIADWWNQDEIQSSVKYFRERVACVSDDFMGQWMRVLSV